MPGLCKKDEAIYLPQVVEPSSDRLQVPGQHAANLGRRLDKPATTRYASLCLDLKFRLVEIGKTQGCIPTHCCQPCSGARIGEILPDGALQALPIVWVRHATSLKISHDIFAAMYAVITSMPIGETILLKCGVTARKERRLTSGRSPIIIGWIRRALWSRR
jgi:hypothetical protein